MIDFGVTRCRVSLINRKDRIARRQKQRSRWSVHDTYDQGNTQNRSSEEEIVDCSKKKSICSIQLLYRGVGFIFLGSSSATHVILLFTRLLSSHNSGDASVHLFLLPATLDTYTRAHRWFAEQSKGSKARTTTLLGHHGILDFRYLEWGGKRDRAQDAGWSARFRLGLVTAPICLGCPRA